MQPGERVYSYFYWEFILLWEKIVIIATIVNFGRPYMQGAIVMFMLVMFTLLQMRNNVYSSRRLNSMHAMSLFIIILIALCKFIIYGLASYSSDVSTATKEKLNKLHIKLSRSYQGAGDQEGLEQ